MTVTVAELAGATDEEISSVRSVLTSYLQSLYPNLSVRACQLADLLLGPASVALAAVEHRGTQIENSVNPETALASGDYDTTTLDSVLAGRGVARIAAATATGSIALVFNTNTQRQIPAGTQFETADGTIIKTSSASRILSSGSTATSSNDVVLTDTGSGSYFCTIEAQASSSGADGNRVAGVTLTPVSTISGLSAAYVAEDLTGGRDEETDAELLARLPSATAPRTADSAYGATGVIQDAYDYLHVAAVGFGHPGMLRGRSVLTGQSPGRSDMRVKVGNSPSRLRLRVTATLDAINTGIGTWRATIERGDCPGWFLVEKAIKTTDVLTATGFTINTVTPGYDIIDIDSPPDIKSVLDAALSYYSTVTVKFEDNTTSTAGLVINTSTKDYDLVVRYIPGIQVSQEAVDADNVRPAGGDCLVRAVIPVMVSLDAAVTVKSGVTLTSDEAATAIARAINESDIGTSLSSARVAADALSYLPSGTTLQLSNWEGIIYPVNTTLINITGTDGLVVSTDWSNGIGEDTVGFYADSSSINVVMS